LTQATGRLKTRFGELVSQWQIDDGKFDWTVVVPPNTTATAYLPLAEGREITLNGQAAAGLVHELGAGKHRLVAR
jgi:alpha-L-rhamnosidase